MSDQTKTVIFDDEGQLQDVLNPKYAGAQSTYDSLKRELEEGTPVIIKVPGFPPRALVNKKEIERLVGHAIGGSDLMLIPFT